MKPRAALAAAIVLSLALVLAQPHPQPAEAPPVTKPSIVLIVTDDQRWDTLWAMPKVQRLLVDQGMTFDDAFVVNSVCCPSRTSILTGQYSHNTGVWSDAPPYGIDAFDPSSTIATWLEAGGYDTALVGKYLNRYSTRAIPPGWTEWDARLWHSDGAYYDYTVNENGTLTDYGDAPKDYATTVDTHLATSFIRQNTGPLFLMYSTKSPHEPATPAPKDTHAFAGLGHWRPGNYDESDVGDKPDWVRMLPQLDSQTRREIDHFRKDQYRTLLSIDRGVGAIVSALRSTGRLSNTMIVFTSDNGMAWGEHRWKGKLSAYEESIRVPMVLRYDPLTGSVPQTNSDLVTNIDLAPTFAEVAGVPAPNVDGQSMVPLLSPPAPPFRNDFLIEHVDHTIPSYCAIRSQAYTYVDYATGEEELYDLAADPLELDNVASVPANTATMNAMRTRVAELCSPPPPGSGLP